MAVHQQVCLRGWLLEQAAAESKKFDDMVLSRHDGRRNAILDDVVEAQFELCVFAEGTECHGHRMVRVEDGEDVTDPGSAVADQFLDAADTDPERREGVHRPDVRALAADKRRSSAAVTMNMAPTWTGGRDAASQAFATPVDDINGPLRFANGGLLPFRSLRAACLPYQRLLPHILRSQQATACE